MYISNAIGKTSFRWAILILSGVLVGYGVVAVSGVFGYFAPLAAIVGVAAVAVMLLSTEAALIVLMSAVVLFQREELFEWSIPLFGGGLKIPDVILMLGLTGFVLRSVFADQWVQSSELQNRDTRTFKIVLSLFIAWAFLSAFLGIRRGLPYKDSLLELRPLVQYLWFFLIVQTLRVRQLKRVLIVTFGMCFVISIQGLVLFAKGEGTVGTFNGGYVRIMSVEFSYLLFCCLMSAALYLGANRYRAAMIAGMVVSFAALVVTFQRSAFLGLAAGLAIILFWLGSQAIEHLLWSGLTLLLVLAAVIPAAWVVKPELFRPLIALEERLASIEDFREDDSAQHRFREWRSSLDLIRSHPIVGNGLGTRVVFFSPEYEREGTKKGYWSHDIYIHNSYVWTTVKMGLIGLGFLLTMIIMIFQRGFQFLRSQSGSAENRVLTLGLLACLAALVVISFFGPMITSPNLTPFVAVVGATIWLVDRESSEGRSQPVTPGRYWH